MLFHYMIINKLLQQYFWKLLNLLKMDNFHFLHLNFNMDLLILNLHQLIIRIQKLKHSHLHYILHFHNYKYIKLIIILKKILIHYYKHN